VSSGRKKRRGTSRRGKRGNRVFLGVRVPEAMAKAVDETARKLNLDGASFLRQALEEKIGKQNKPRT
jgi:hypothetical protein